MIPIKSDREIRFMRDACAVAATVLDKMCQMAKKGVSTLDLDIAAKDFMSELSCRSACYNYGYDGIKYPAYTCISVNDEVIHGIPSRSRILGDGDIVSMDVSVFYRGWVGDNTRTVMIGKCAPEVEQLVKATDEALHLGIAAAKSGNKVGDVSHAIQTCLDSFGYGIVREFTGHGVGKKLHEDPQVPNYGKANSGPMLRSGMTIAIEPMVNMGSASVFVKDDGWTVCTSDGKPSCHIEHTVLVTPNGGEILTLPKK